MNQGGERPERVAGEALTEALRPLGFEPRTRSILTRPLDGADGIVGWLSTGLLSRPGPDGEKIIDASPFVGVLDPVAERWLARLTGRRHRPFAAATFSDLLTSLAKRGPAYRLLERGTRQRAMSDGPFLESLLSSGPAYRVFEHGTLQRETVTDLVRDLESFALPFMSANADRDSLLRTVKGHGHQGHEMFQLPLLFALTGQRRRAVAAIRRAKGVFASETAALYGDKVLDYNAFARTFEACLDELLADAREPRRGA